MYIMMVILLHFFLHCKLTVDSLKHNKEIKHLAIDRNLCALTSV